MSEPAGFPWGDLGIPPTRDRQAIRAAYAARLKRLDIRAEPAAFQRLRSAYEAALVSGQPAPPPPEPPAPVLRNELAGEIDTLITAGNSEAAAEKLAASGAGALSFDDLAGFERRLLLQTPEMARAPLLALVRRFDWHYATHPLRSRHPDLFRQLDQRLWLEEWHADLTRQGRTSLLARLMVKGRPGWRDYLFACWAVMFSRHKKKLTSWLDQIEPAPHAGEVFDAERLRWCRRWLRPARLYVGILLIIYAAVPAVLIAHESIGVLLAVLLAVLVMGAVTWGYVRLVLFVYRCGHAGVMFVLRRLRAH